MSALAPYTKYFAEFNNLGNHRYVLHRMWDDGPVATVIGLNPSTADFDTDDPTIRSIVRILKHNRYGGLYMVNLFTYVTPYPKELERVATCKYDERQCERLWNRYDHGHVVFAWGNFPTHGRGDRAILSLRR